MKTTDFIEQSLKTTRHYALSLIEDMRDASRTAPTPQGGNSPIWVLGHIVRSESDLLDAFILGKPNRFPELEERFAMGSHPTSDGDYPEIDDLLGKFEEIRAATLEHLRTLSDEDLARPSHAPDEIGPEFGTVGACFAAMANHTMFHAGQVADARRAAGRSPLLA